MPFDLCKIGQLLKSAREEKGLTLDQVADALFIRKRVVAAIEAGDWETLPHPVYVRGYVTQYASLLKVQDAVEGAMMPAALEQKPVETEEGAPMPAPSPRERTLRAWKPRNRIMAAAAMGAVVVGFFVFQNLLKPTYVTPPVQSAESTYRVAAATTTATTATAASPYQAVETTAGQTVDVSSNQPTGTGAYDRQEERVVLETKKLTIACQERTWVRVIIDGTETKEFMLNPDEVVMLDAKECFDLLIGNAAGVRLIYNGKDVGFTGEAGEVKRINLS